jgi:excisionase family DNA binding protein
MASTGNPSASSREDGVPGGLLRVRELAQLLNVSQAWIRKGVLERTLPYTKLGRSIRFTPAQVEQILAAGQRPPLRGPAHQRTHPGAPRTRL